MEKISIKHLGPIEEISMDLSKDMNLIIGPQASGKSTLGKIIFFCKKIKDYTIEFLEEEDYLLNTPESELYLSFLKFIRKKYMESFGTTRHFSKSFEVKYDFQTGKNVIIRLDEKGYVKFRFSTNIEGEIKELIQSAKHIYEDDKLTHITDDYDYVTQKQLLQILASKRFREKIADIFDSYDVIYIPAGRSLLSVLSDQLDMVDASILDLSMREFVEKIRQTKKRFGTKLDIVVADYVKTVKGQIKNTDIELAQKLIKDILRADYINDTDGEKLYVDEKHWVKLIYGSSGQQEALWILLLLFLVILENRKSYIVIEEPEAHLYPVAQRRIMELTALAMNSSGSRILVTTHSPYIMTSANLLIHSGRVENQIKNAGGKVVIPKQLRIHPKKVSAYKFTEDVFSHMESISDDETGMMDSVEIDGISDMIYADSEKLIDLEIEYGL